MRLTTAAAIAATALFATASITVANAGESDFHTYTKMPQASSTHSYTPAPADKNAPKTYSPYTKMPTGSVAQAPQPNSTNPQTQTYPPPKSQMQK